MKNLSDEKLDQILSKIVKTNALSEDAVDEIADSPQLLWNVRRSIAAQKAVSKKSWFAAFSWRIPAFASLLFLIGIGVFWSLSLSETPEIVAETKAVEVIMPEKVSGRKVTKSWNQKLKFAENESFRKKLVRR